MEALTGKKIKLYFDDGEKVAYREGTITSETDFAIILDEAQIIPKVRIVRLEVVRMINNY